MAKAIKIYSKCTGINNKVDPSRIPYDPETGVTDLEAGIDILIDKSGGIVSSRGSVLAAEGDFISAYPAKDGALFVVKNRSQDSAIYKGVPRVDGLTVDLYGICSGLTKDAKVDFCEVAGKIYYMNGFEHGVINGADAAEAWPISVWPRETTAPMIRVTPGNHLDMLSGRFIISYDDEIQWTEPGLWGLIDNNRNWRRLESRCLMIASVGTGCFISDEKAIWWVAGLDPNKWIPEKVLNYPAQEFCRFPGMIDPSQHGFSTARPSVLFGTVNGPVIGLPDGTAINLIDKKVKMPSGCNSGAIMVVDETIIIQSNGV